MVVRRAATRNRAHIRAQESSLAALVAVANANVDQARLDEVRALVRGLLSLLPGAHPFGDAFAAVINPGDSLLVYVPTVQSGGAFDEAAARDTLRALQPPVRQFLGVATSSGTISGFHPIRAEIFSNFISPQTGNAIMVFADFRDCILLSMLTLLVAPTTRARLRRCPECETFLIRIKRKKFCSELCKSRVNSRRRQQRVVTEEQRLRRAERAHKYYEQKQRKLHGSRVKVQRRPRLKLPKTTRPRRKRR